MERPSKPYQYWDSDVLQIHDNTIKESLMHKIRMVAYITTHIYFGNSQSNLMALFLIVLLNSPKIDIYCSKVLPTEAEGI